MKSTYSKKKKMLLLISFIALKVKRKTKPFIG